MAQTLFNGWLILSIASAAGYVLLIGTYLRGWRRLQEWHLPPDYQPFTKVSLLIPARNEAANLPACLEAIARQKFPGELLEVLILDDHSTDETLQVAEGFAARHPHFRALRLADFLQPGETQSFKKRAIEIGVKQASGSLIVCTDADCIAPPDWLALFVSFFEKKQWALIAAPVRFYEEKNLLERFQSLDFLGMMGVTGAGIELKLHHLCNGANLACPKAVFEAVGGYAGTEGRASGDDIFLAQKIAARYPGKVGFLKNPAAAVRTRAMPDVPSFLSQRIRWATKSRSCREWKMTFCLGWAFLFCCAIAGTPVWAWWIGTEAWALFGALLAVKLATDWMFLGTMARYFGRPDLMRSYLPSQFLHIVYIVSVGFLGNVVRRYEWKGRRVK